MKIKIGFDFLNKKINNNEPKEVVVSEKSLLEKMIPKIHCEPNELKVVNNSDDYTTLQYKQIDIVRIKYTPSAKWIKIRMSIVDMKAETDNPLFTLQNKKTESMWKCNIDDIDKLYPYINNFIIQFNNVNK